MTDARHAVTFDRSSLDAAFEYLADPSEARLRALVELPGSRLAYAHHRWATPDAVETIEEFWRRALADDRDRNAADVREVVRSLLAREQQEWLDEVVRYLPRDHVFRSTVHLLLGYDNVVYGEDVALNVGFRQFHEDHREAVYYLIHELAHAGYCRYHRLPEIASLRTRSDLADAVRCFTQLEGMGVLSALRLRKAERGLSDEDYRILEVASETEARVRRHRAILEDLDLAGARALVPEDLDVLEEMSSRPTRLWYVTGCAMARTIEEARSRETLRALVRAGHAAFFAAYNELSGSTLDEEGALG